MSALAARQAKSVAIGQVRGAGYRSYRKRRIAKECDPMMGGDPLRYEMMGAERWLQSKAIASTIAR